jgi:hypothetical protein
MRAEGGGTSGLPRRAGVRGGAGPRPRLVIYHFPTTFTNHPLAS